MVATGTPIGIGTGPGTTTSSKWIGGEGVLAVNCVRTIFLVWSMYSSVTVAATGRRVASSTATTVSCTGLSTGTAAGSALTISFEGKIGGHATAAGGDAVAPL